MKARFKEILRSIRGIWQNYKAKTIPINKILRGGELGFSSEAVSIHYKNILWGSERAIPSPHSLLLHDYQNEGELIFNEDRFIHTEYYKYGANCIDHFHNFFEAYQKTSVVEIAKHFVNRVFHPEKNKTVQSPFTCYSNKYSPIVVSPVAGSSYYQLEDGYHRLAQAHFAGNKNIRAYIKKKSVFTPLQQLLLKDSRSYGKMILHQPLIAPEVEEDWQVLMPTKSIFEEIKKIVEKQFTNQSKKNLNALDVGARYGWFVKNMLELEIDTRGLENDYTCLQVAKTINKLSSNQINSGNFFEILPTLGTCNIVICLDEMPRAHLKASCQLPDLFLKTLSDKTEDILILSMGHLYRGLPHQNLKSWNPSRTMSWITSFNYFEKVELIEINSFNPLFICYKKSK